MAVAVHRNAVTFRDIPLKKLRGAILIHIIPQKEEGSRNAAPFQDIQHFLCILMRAVIEGEKCQVLFTFKGFLPPHPCFHIRCVIGIGGSFIGVIGAFLEPFEILHFRRSFFRRDLFCRSLWGELLHFREFFDFHGFPWIPRFR